MSVMTVTGDVASEALGVVLPHEHMFIDLRNQFTEFKNPEKQTISQQPLCMGNLGAVRMNPYAIKDNLLLDDVDIAVQEAEHFKRHGGHTIVDCTSIGIHRNPIKLRELAQRSGLNIVAGCGYYTHDTHPDAMDEWSAEQIADHMLCDMLEGIDGTGVRAGIYGEIGTSDPIRPNEEKCLQATAIAFGKKRAEVQIHTFPWAKAGLEASRVLIDGGVDPTKIVICHTDVEFNVPYILELLRLGVNIEFDNFGKEFFILKEDRGFAGGVFARDIERVRVIIDLLEKDYQKQILVTNDICMKSMLRVYGGTGYDHILCHIVPMMKGEGISEETIDAFLKENPARVLCD